MHDKFKDVSRWLVHTQIVPTSQGFQLANRDKAVSISTQYYLMHIIPIGLPMALSMQFGNTAYLFLTVSFMEMLKVRQRLPTG